MFWFGTCTHAGNSGVNYYSRFGDYGFWTYNTPTTGWVGLELAVNAGTQLKDGSIGGYCINRAPLDEHEQDRPDCPFIVMKACVDAMAPRPQCNPDRDTRLDVLQQCTTWIVGAASTQERNIGRGNPHAGSPSTHIRS